jgi:hypothetical protein
MSEFVEGLREQLVAAAAREEARTAPRMPLPRLRPMLVAAAGAGIAAILVLAVAGGLKTDPRGPDRPAGRPEAVGRDLFGGTLDPGVRYRTRSFAPPLSFAVPGDQWYASDTDQRDRLRLQLFSRPDERSYSRIIGVLGFDHITRVYSPAIPGRKASLISAPVDLYGWLRRHPDLRVGGAQPVTVGGVPGRSFAVEARFDRPAHGDPFCRRRFQVTCTLIAPGASFTDGTRLRLTILPLDPDPLIISAGSFTSRGYEKLEGPAAQVLKTLRIGVTSP